MDSWPQVRRGISYLLLVVAMIVFYLQLTNLVQRRAPFTLPKLSKEPSVSQTSSTVQQSKNKTSYPDPLKLLKDAEGSNGLTVEGILEWTNAVRGKAGVPPLTLNQQLCTAAEEKVRDQYLRGYFAHVSPIGVTPSDLVERSGYKAIISGENLALGNFRDDEHVVQAWMDSPGHRANLLRGAFTEIGIATAGGEIEGRKVWIAVQSFATPTTACPAPDDSLSITIEENKVALAEGLAHLQGLRGQIESSTATLSARQAAIAKFNELNEYRNGLTALSNELVAEFNTQISEYNQCIRQYGEGFKEGSAHE